MDGACAVSFDNEELYTREEVDLIGRFFQTIRDWRDLGPDLEPNDGVRVAFELTQEIADLEKAGFFIFSARQKKSKSWKEVKEPHKLAGRHSTCTA